MNMPFYFLMTEYFITNLFFQFPLRASARDALEYNSMQCYALFTIFLLLNELDISHAASKAYAANGGIYLVIEIVSKSKQESTGSLFHRNRMNTRRTDLVAILILRGS